MFKRMQNKWGVSARQFWIIFIIFGLTGTTTAFITRYITGWLGYDSSTHWGWKLLLQLAMLLVGYQGILLGYGALLGQWAFFWKYEKKLLQKLGILKSMNYEQMNKKQRTGNNHRPQTTDHRPQTTDHKPQTTNHKPQTTNHRPQTTNHKPQTTDHRPQTTNHKPQTTNHRPQTTNHRPQTTNHKPQTTNHKPQTNIAIFASGAGSNAAKIIAHFNNHSSIVVALIVCNKPEAGVLSIAQSNNIPTLLIEKERFFEADAYLPVLQQHQVHFIVLAGFLWKVPTALTEAYRGMMINIHPALLPKYGGKGMYGAKVHESVIAAGETESGITIHYVNEYFDEGKPVFQARCTVDKADTPNTLAQKIHALEHAHFALVIEKLILKITV